MKNITCPNCNKTFEVDAAGFAASITAGLGRDRACIDDNFVCLVGIIDKFMAGCHQLACHGFNFTLVETTADAVQVNFHICN